MNARTVIPIIPWKDQTLDHWFAAINRYLLPAMPAFLVIAIAYQLATLTWTLAPGSAPASALPPSRAATGRTPEVDLGVLTDSNLFGQEADQTTTVVPEVVDAPETTLSLVLKGPLGLVGEEDEPPSSAIISSGGEDKTYRVGQAIDGADGATLHSVYSDRVLLNHNGRVETLRLPEELVASSSRVVTPPLPQTSPQSGSLHEVFSENATRLMDILRPAPHIQEGQVIGFRVTPGRDRAGFEALGLRPGDVVTDINGTALDDVSQGLQVFQALGETTQANVTVLRDGVPQVIVIDTRQLERLQQNRE
jgi:general secretion pathway protein C